MDRFDCQFLMGTFVNVYFNSFIMNKESPEKLLAQVIQSEPNVDSPTLPTRIDLNGKLMNVADLRVESRASNGDFHGAQGRATSEETTLIHQFHSLHQQFKRVNSL